MGNAYILLEYCYILLTNKEIVVWCSNGRLDAGLEQKRIEHEREHDIDCIGRVQLGRVIHVTNVSAGSHRNSGGDWNTYPRRKRNGRKQTLVL